ncbi:gliding motility-associated ABC transporter substrate-binding protein GldG [Pontibacter sp. BT310]|uniref:Gliding motility-associated ABC transporter substrate-binding protein GldG n=1 Tax=Pontibacter populi TaxID=890055 RepID=A0ABS6XEU5_9BACT|nr:MULTISPECIES: gliding motility-associated ABC transporter substrate-binding protein GldG [Pontibacter]MBJ6119664.1 gliding motility-associated ABC transporter substrate-binding protein GldG [Pontibacter sp. BT310]MBR0572093.1 gliding motility-associated ABC transporter substrate-binding protein GldG [Microvirga sp. STS03]MBW3366517.1 gliding motility-associated ABC transporter substrate-binding protein GldG [Pontibacter populi]
MVTQETSKSTSNRRHDLTRYVIAIVVLVVLNMLVYNYFFRIDLTEDKRYSIAPVTEQMLGNLEEEVFVEVYLEGDFPAGFKRLQQSVRENLEEFRIYADGKVRFVFFDPNSITDEQKRTEFMQQLAQKGIQPTNLKATEEGKQVERLVFPGAIVRYKGKETAVNFLKGNLAASPDERLNQSVEGVEYELATAVRKVAFQGNKVIGYITGQGELPQQQATDLLGSLQEYYRVALGELDQIPTLKGLDLIIVAKPTTAFSEADKFKIDQFIMNGGKAVFFVDALNADLDSLAKGGTFALPYNLNLEDMFFKYGVRFNPTLIMDLNSGFIPLVTGFTGGKPQTEMINWRFYPLLNTFSKHPVTRNLDAVYSKFIGTIDTVKAAGIRKTPLIYTSQYSRIMQVPVPLTLEEARMEVNPEQYQAGEQPVGYLLEGSFTSLFRNRRAPEGMPNTTIKEQGVPTKIAVFSDGDLIRNDINPRTGQAYELGFDRFNNIKFANKELAMNTIHYLLDADGLINIRSKEIKLRPLDRVRVQEEKTYWQALNLVAPIALLALFGVARYYMRKRRYEKF